MSCSELLKVQESLKLFPIHKWYLTKHSCLQAPRPGESRQVAAASDSTAVRQGLHQPWECCWLFFKIQSLYLDPPWESWDRRGPMDICSLIKAKSGMFRALRKHLNVLKTNITLISSLDHPFFSNMIKTLVWKLPSEKPRPHIAIFTKERKYGLQRKYCGK